jgi:UDP-N-acetylglucosamine--N-acetylmuramyl-(pentapeptide) pyrophosphoryl-undecaprenol N-acetylglucosamine transferase
VIRPIGYYVHHQGAGHRHRARSIAGALRRPCTLIGTFAENRPELDGLSVLDLPDDRPSGATNFAEPDGAESRPAAFHYAPLDHAGVRRRMAMLAAWIAAHDPVLLVVDVSVEIALFARLMGIKTAVMRLAGARVDTPHLEAFRSAALVLAPFPAPFESTETPRWVRDKTFYGGFLAPTAEVAPGGVPIRSVAVVCGSGGGPNDLSAVVHAARATPDVAWHVYGPGPATSFPVPNLHVHGWRADIGAALDAADVVIGGCGDGLLADVAARAKRFICLPEARPFNEQRDKSRVLAEHRWAVVLDTWPEPDAWPDVFCRAQALDPTKLHALTDPKAIERVAAKLEALADER